MITFGLITLGCKVNFYESEWIRQQLEDRGWSFLKPSGRCPDHVIVNTCTVTGKADRQSRQAIYRMARRCPETRITVTGCYAQRAPEPLAALPGVASVVSNEEKKKETNNVFPTKRPEKLEADDARQFPFWKAHDAQVALANLFRFLYQYRLPI
jgi:threonylcarbamoyladenosine tRNA methylthiotransferase MtaB